jgi:hypothetical protein
MPETFPTEPTPSADDTEFASGPSPEYAGAERTPVSHAKDSSPAPRVSKLSRWATLAALVLAVIATSVAVVGWFYPNKSASAPTYSDQQTKDAKKHICEAFGIVERAVVKSSHLKNPENGGPIGALSIATARNFAFYSGGAFLRDQVSQNPATPPDLAKSVNDLGTSLEELSIGALSGASQFAQDQLGHSADDRIKASIEICKK